MRLWSIHPKYLDSTGLVACWREALLAKKVLEGKTKGYRHHPQLIRFRESGLPQAAIRIFLQGLADEAEQRGYNFNRSLIGSGKKLPKRISVTKGQIDYELKHLKRKLKERAPNVYRLLIEEKEIISHPMFRIKAGDIETWEIR